MRYRIICVRMMFLFVILYSVNLAHAQSDCKVIMPAISESYSGNCKNGFAQGKGKAHGIDSYEGQFNKGLPHGKGIYTWANGIVYEGQWADGLRDGKGKMVYHLAGGDSVVTGYWKNDKYIGEKFIPPYKVTISRGVIRYSMQKINDTGNEVAIRLLIGGRINSDIEELSLAYDSGEEYKSGDRTGIQNVLFPINVKLKYRTWNQLHTSQSDVIFEFSINEPGAWDVTITN